MQAVDPNTCRVRAKETREFQGGGSRFAVGDTLMARITPCLENGKITQFTADSKEIIGHGSTEFIIIRGRPNVSDTNFVYYLTRWDDVRLFAIAQMSGTSGRQRVPTDSLQNLDVELPSLLEQQKIAHILGSLDDKIELNSQMNETLEAMVLAIFKSWFVDFDPVRAKVEGRQPAGIDVETIALLPEHFEDSEIGEIPSGWKIERFEKILRHSTERIGSEHAIEYSATVTGLTLRYERFNKQLSKTREKNKKIVKGDFVFGLSRKIVNFGLMKENIDRSARYMRFSRLILIFIFQNCWR